MSIHKLTAGSGYDYLTRQVAALDATEKGHVGLASYYTEKGERPGTWVGSGLSGIDGLGVGDAVTADQMQSLFGSGHHPLATARVAELDHRIGRAEEPAPSEADYRAATRLGAPFRVYDNDVSEFRVEVARRLGEINQAAGLPSDWPVPAAQRARVRTEVAQDLFRSEYGREPADAREIAGTIAKHSRPKTNAVAAYDLTFSPVKSVSVLWAVADPRTAAVIERAHQAAVRDALEFIETHALFTREGTNGVRQVDVRGLVAAAFVHRDSRAGDPDLHTHVAVANKVQTVASEDGSGGGGKWLAIDGRLLFKAKVSASETYNTRLEHYLVDALGVQFAARPAGPGAGDVRKRPIREIVSVDPEVNARFSKRRMRVEERRDVLAGEFQAIHGRPPTPVEMLHLAQRATLETREAKHEPRCLAQQRSVWHAEAVQVLGSERALKKMVQRALHPRRSDRGQRADARWVAEAVDRIVAAMQERRATWQYWHVYAEAQRQVRGVEVPTEQVDQLVALLVGEVLEGRSVSITRPVDDLVGPPQLRRRDGSSAYTVAGAYLFTSRSVLDAEQRLVTAAGRRDGYTVDERHVTVALLESEANGLALNPGQAALVREMATSGARLQLAIAPAGSGKTTAMRSLAQAWAESGGEVVGLAPSAAAAEALRTAMGDPDSAGSGPVADTLAKLVHTLTDPRGHAQAPAWVDRIGPSTLVVIDEAGTADTLSLDLVVQHVLAAGGSVRLVGDDQQQSAIGAGGVLRDIRATHGALQLSELVRFTDAAEAAASLALREGRLEALGFYLDRDRVHVGDLATMTEEAFVSWRADRARGLDSIMLAPTRDLVSELNQQARAHRLEGVDPNTVGAVRVLADGNQASVGELIITRENDRRLRVSATDWVKNGDRWSIVSVERDGALRAQHTQHGRIVRLPTDYVDRATELGYACTIRTAQGVTADTMHGLLTGGESRQQLYTLLTRGRLENHAYLPVVGDGDPHSVIQPSMVRPLTPTDMLEDVLAHDEGQHSATTLIAEQTDPVMRLGEVTQRYLDSLYLAAEHTLGTAAVEALETAVEEAEPGLCDEPAWPALRAHLILLAAHGVDPITELRSAAAQRELSTAIDRAAVLDWRLDATGLRNAGPGPLPWLPGIPHHLAADSHWGTYLTDRAHLVTGLSTTVRHAARRQAAEGHLPLWAQSGLRPGDAVIAEIEVWRAAMQVPVEDRRPTGPPQLGKAAVRYQRRLIRRATGSHSPALREWHHLLNQVAPQVTADEFTPLLAQRLAAISRSGVPVDRLLRTAAHAGPLPDEHAAAALWWRMARHLSPAVAQQVDQSHHLTADWLDQLTSLVGPERAQRLQASNWWPALVANLDHALARGWTLQAILGHPCSPAGDTGEPIDASDTGGGPGGDECQTLVWRTSVALSPIPPEQPDEAAEAAFDPAPEDLWEGIEHPADDTDIVWIEDEPPTTLAAIADRAPQFPVEAASDHTEATGTQEKSDEDRFVEGDLRLAAMVRDAAATTPLEQTEVDVRRMLERAEQWDHCPVSRERMLQINDLAQVFFEAHYAQSWGRIYLTDRFGIDLAGHEHYRPGQAPAGWTNLVDHLRRQGVAEAEMLATGIAKRASTGHLIDRFRDRVVFPLLHHGDRGTEILGFVGRRHPDLAETDRHGGPKYLNTPATPLFHKRAQLFGVIEGLLVDGGTPVIVEGPTDAIAVTLATAGRYVGVAPLGTSLTEEQAAQLADLRRRGGRDPVVATDADLAGQVAAERAFWMLTPHGLEPRYACLPHGMDPSSLLTLRGPAALAGALVTTAPLSSLLLTERLDNIGPGRAQHAAIQVLAASPPQVWDEGTEQIHARLGRSEAEIRRDLRDAIRTWDADPRRAAAVQLGDIGQVRARLQAAAAKSPADRWAGLATELDPRLLGQVDWPATAAILQQAYEQGHDVAGAARELIGERSLGDRPARDLRYRLVSHLDIAIDPTESVGPSMSEASLASTAHRRPRTKPEKQPRRGSDARR